MHKHIYGALECCIAQWGNQVLVRGAAPQAQDSMIPPIYVVMDVCVSDYLKGMSLCPRIKASVNTLQSQCSTCDTLFFKIMLSREITHHCSYIVWWRPLELKLQSLKRASSADPQLLLTHFFPFFKSLQQIFSFLPFVTLSLIILTQTEISFTGGAWEM